MLYLRINEDEKIFSFIDSEFIEPSENDIPITLEEHYQYMNSDQDYVLRDNPNPEDGLFGYIEHFDREPLSLPPSWEERMKALEAVMLEVITNAAISENTVPNESNR